MRTCGTIPRGVTAGAAPRAPEARGHIRESTAIRAAVRTPVRCRDSSRFASRTTPSRSSGVGTQPVISTTAGDQGARGRCTVSAIGSAASDSSVNRPSRIRSCRKSASTSRLRLTWRSVRTLPAIAIIVSMTITRLTTVIPNHRDPRLGPGRDGGWRERRLASTTRTSPPDCLARRRAASTSCPTSTEEDAWQVPDAGVARAASVGTESRPSVGSEVPTVLDEGTLALKSTARR